MLTKLSVGLPKEALIALRERSGSLMDLRLPESVLPLYREEKTYDPIRVSDHALREFRRKFPRYTRDLDEGELVEDLRSFVKKACKISEEEGKEALIYHAPIWDMMKVILRPGERTHEIVTVSRRQKNNAEETRRSVYGILLGIQLCPLNWYAITQKLSRFEHSNGRQGWGLVLRCPNGRVPVLGVCWTTHELLSFLAYRNYHGPVALAHRLNYLANRLGLPDAEGEAPSEEMAKGFSAHGLWVDPPSPEALDTEMLNAMIRRAG